MSASLPSTSLSPALVATVLHAADVSCLAQVKAICRAASLAASLGHGHTLPFVRVQETCLLYSGDEVSAGRTLARHFAGINRCLWENRRGCPRRAVALQLGFGIATGIR